MQLGKNSNWGLEYSEFWELIAASPQNTLRLQLITIKSAAVHAWTSANLITIKSAAVHAWKSAAVHAVHAWTAADLL